MSNAFVRAMSYILCAIVLSSCTTVTNSTIPIHNQAQNTPNMSADAYLALANQQQGQERQSLQLQAAYRSVMDGQWEQAQQILANTGDITTTELAAQKNMLLAKIDLNQKEPRAALSKLSAITEPNDLPVPAQQEFHNLLALAYQSSGNAAESVIERNKLDNLLQDGPEKTNNLQTLWQNLNAMPIAELSTLATEADEASELVGWYKIALISRKHNTNREAMQSEVENWKIQYPQHPAETILTLDSSPAVPSAAPKKIALLLPVTGLLSGPGSAVRDGFMAAAKSQADIKVAVYDTNKTDVTALYGQAVDEGADYIVGPLTKIEVAVIAKLDHPVPTLLLNDFANVPKPNAFQFGLSPSGEARQVADKIRDKGYSRTLVIAPAGPWGDEVTQAFTSQLKANGGTVTDILSYRADEDLNKAIKHLLQISDSEQRIKELKSLLGYHLEAAPMRRQDFDTIFLLAYPSKARQLMPLLQYYYANNIPVYATSAVYAGNPNKMRDNDLDGIHFCDMPWVFKKPMASKNWPEQFNSYGRLYALGMDSFALGTQLTQLQTMPAMGLPQKSGVLYLKPNQQVGRNLAWARFANGTAQPIESAG